jgi:hypothetical protein
MSRGENLSRSVVRPKPKILVFLFLQIFTDSDRGKIKDFAIA